MSQTNVVEASSSLQVHGGYPVINHSGLPDTLISGDESMREIAGKLSRWIDNARSASTRTNLFDRGAYVPPDNVYDEMLAARKAVVNDDMVAGVHEITESFALQGVKWEGPSPDEADVFNQINQNINLDNVIRSMWKEVYTYSQFVAATIWDYRTFKVRGRTKDGHKRKKEYTVYCPVKVAILDSTKVVPIAHGPLGTPLLAWCSTNQEVENWLRAKRGERVDPLMEQFFVGTYEPDPAEKAELTKLGVDVNNLLVLNPGMVWRHTTTKADYERFAPVRMKSIFKLLDLKQQLINADRAMLIGAANYILVVRKGTDDLPAKEPELKNLKENFKFIAKMPVIISDHRLEVEIVAPKQDFTLQGDRYDLIDQRILMRLLGTLSLGSKGQRNETNVTLSRAVGRNMESRRHMIRRDLEEHLARSVYNHPRNIGVFDEGEEPNLVFVPRNIALEIDAAFIQAMMGLRQQQEISRETILEYFGLDQEAEAQRRVMEEEQYDDIFKTIVPFASPDAQPGTPDQTGRQGGRPAGGGESSRDPKKATNRTSQGNTSTGD